MVEIDKLTRAQVAALKEPGRYSDGKGLFLVVGPSGSKNWLFRYQLAGRRRDMGLGAVDDVSLSKARSLRDAARELIRLGQDPIVAREGARAALENMVADESAAAVPTFKQCAAELIAMKQREWKNAKHGAQWAATLETYAYPVIGDLPVDQVSQDHILKILTPIWLSKNETAGRVRGRIETILGWATVKKYRQGDNPAAWKANLEFLLQKPALIKTVRRQPSLPYSFVPDLVAMLLKRGTTPAHALVIIILTALRQSEVRLARGGEIDHDAQVWVVPPERVKRPLVDGGEKQPHRVSVSPLEVALLTRFGDRTSEYLLPGARENRPLSETSIRKLIADILTKKENWPHFTMHGFRSTFKNWVMECSEIPEKDMLSEAQLCHSLGNQVKLAYLRTTLIERRRVLMQDWRSYCLSTTPQALLTGLSLSSEALARLGLPEGVTPIAGAWQASQ